MLSAKTVQRRNVGQDIFFACAAEEIFQGGADGFAAQNKKFKVFGVGVFVDICVYYAQLGKVCGDFGNYRAAAFVQVDIAVFAGD